jgi:murein DD-endopeptidase MepM/ murein hydrolase activator NlpD
MIRPGDELIVTTVEPPLTVNRIVREYVEEYYDADIEYVYNDDWYTTDKETLRQPSCGRRNIVAETTYTNDKEVVRDILKEELVMEAVAKRVEVGTKIPPTYIKPIAGGRLTSTFGYRKRPNAKGATSNHQGVDWATPTGTAVMASCGGTVSKAGWASGYGYCVFIDHEDGRQTRYGHLSKVLVKVGQKVRQGEKIALSGNTGVSTGAHLHFEMRYNGTYIDPATVFNFSEGTFINAMTEIDEGNLQVVEAGYQKELSKHRYYKVRRGDCLGKIARKYGISITRLKQLNGIKGNMIRPGQVLRCS